MKNTQKCMLAGLVVCLAVWAFGMFMFWVSGHEFRRGPDLGFAVFITTVLGLLVGSFMAASLYDWGIFE